MTAATVSLSLDADLEHVDEPACDYYGDRDRGECATFRATWYARLGCGHDRLTCDGHAGHLRLLLNLGSSIECRDCGAPIFLDELEWCRL